MVRHRFNQGGRIDRYGHIKQYWALNNLGCSSE
jgi:hypothetical protein